MPFLAHQGGWDELLMFAAPILAVMLWVRWAERKARERARHPDRAEEGPLDGGTLAEDNDPRTQ